MSYSYTLGGFNIKTKKLRKQIIKRLIRNPNRSDYHKAIIHHLFTHYYTPTRPSDPDVMDLYRNSFKSITHPKREEPVHLTFHDRPSLQLTEEHLTPQQGVRSVYKDLRDNVSLRLKHHDLDFESIQKKLMDKNPRCFITSTDISPEDETVLLFLPPYGDIKILEHANFEKSTQDLRVLFDQHLNPALVKADAISDDPGFICPTLR